jgi:hypothetical protein
MTAPAQDQYVTRDELAARLAELELRLERRMNDLERRVDDHFRTQLRWIIGLGLGLIGLILPIYALLIAGLFFLYNAKP